MSTIQRYALINPSNNNILNIVLFDSTIEPPVPISGEIYVQCGDTVGTNWTYTNGNFIAPPQLLPNESNVTDISILTADGWTINNNHFVAPTNIPNHIDDIKVQIAAMQEQLINMQQQINTLIR